MEGCLSFSFIRLELIYVLNSLLQLLNSISSFVGITIYEQKKEPKKTIYPYAVIYSLTPEILPERK